MTKVNNIQGLSLPTLNSGKKHETTIRPLTTKNGVRFFFAKKKTKTTPLPCSASRPGSSRRWLGPAARGPDTARRRRRRTV